MSEENTQKTQNGDSNEQNSADSTKFKVQMSKENLLKIVDAIKKSPLPMEDKKYWAKNLKNLNKRQLKQLWNIFHADTNELNKIIEEEGKIQLELKEKLDNLVKEGTAAIYKKAEEEEDKIEEAELNKLLRAEGIE